MMKPYEKKVIFLPCKSPQEKKHYLFKVANKHFEEKKKLMFFHPDSNSLQFISQFLWEYSLDSFLPHETYSPEKSPQKGFIFLSTLLPKNFNCSIFNLTKSTIDDQNNLFTTVYEFDPVYQEDKKKIIEDKVHQYQKLQRRIISL